MMTAIVAAACGGGGGSGDSGLPPLPAAARPAALPGTLSDTEMSCVNEPVFPAGGTTQCSGSTVLRTDNGVSITRSGVQAHGSSTVNLNSTTPKGLGIVDTIPAGSAVAEMRLSKSPTQVVQRAFLLLDNLNVTWDGTNQRPRIVEAFEPTQGITRVEASGAISVANALPPPPNAVFYNYNAGPPPTGTQANYANNRYFPKPGCAVPCNETDGVVFTAGTAGDPSLTRANRTHGDGDVRAGMVGGMPEPATKGARNITNFNYQYSSIGAWVTVETTFIDEWTPDGQPTEQVVNRRGLIAYGATTANQAVPASGTSFYRGIAYGFYTPNGDDGNAALVSFRAAVTMEANFGSGQVSVFVRSAVNDETRTALPIEVSANAGVGAAGSNAANYMSGPISDGGAGMSGGMGARFFGPAADEIAGTIVLKNATSKAAVLGGFIARKQ